MPLKKKSPTKKVAKKVVKPTDRLMTFSEVQSLIAKMPLSERQINQISEMVNPMVDKKTTGLWNNQILLEKKMTMLAGYLKLQWGDQTTRKYGWFKRNKISGLFI